ERRALVLREVIAAEPLAIETRELEVVVVDRDVLHPRGDEVGGERRLPDALREPEPARPHAEALLDPIGHHLDLIDPIGARDRRQDRLVEAAPPELHLPALDERAD